MYKSIISGLAIIFYSLYDKMPLLFVMIILQIIDYITGIVSACYTGSLSSKAGFKGIVKKISYSFLLTVAFLFDYVILEVADTIGFQVSFCSIFGLLTLCYLIATESISVLENLEEIGIQIPFLSKTLKIFKDKIEEK